MATNIVVPELGDSVIEATITKWIKKEGDPVKVGETIVELETEKANFEVAAERDGILAKILKKENEDVKVGEVLGVIEEGKVEKKAEEKKPEEAEIKTEEKPTSKPEVEIQEEKKEVKITPVAKELARQYNIDISQVTPTGPSNRITKEDIENFVKAKSNQPQLTELPSVEEKPVISEQRVDISGLLPSLSQVYAEREKRVKMSRRRRTIARRMLEAQHNAAILSTFNEIDMSAVMELRRRRKEEFKQKYGVGLGLSSFFVKAVIGALKQFPELNAEIQGDEIVYKYHYDIGVAIGAEEGLVVPVIKEADRKSFAEIEKEIREFVQKANEGKLTMDDLIGGTFTITNGGVFGSLLSTPILNPPQVGILGLHKIEDRPVVVDGEITIRPMMYVALSYDHRIVDGREAVTFLVKVKELIEDPEKLLLEV